MLSLWREYCWLGRDVNRLWRMILPVLAYLTLAYCLFLPFDPPFQPYRGEVCLAADRSLLLFSGIAQIFLIFFVVDATLLCRQFIENLSREKLPWSRASARQKSQGPEPEEGIQSERESLRLVAQRTKVVGRLIYYPFIVVFLMMAARSSYFDHFDWPISLILIFGMNFAYAISCAVMLRRAAECARGNALERLNLQLLNATGRDDKRLVGQLKLVIDEIKDLQEGSFAPLSEQPFFRTILLTVGSAGVLPFAPQLSALLSLGG